MWDLGTVRLGATRSMQPRRRGRREGWARCGGRNGTRRAGAAAKALELRCTPPRAARAFSSSDCGELPRAPAAAPGGELSRAPSSVCGWLDGHNRGILARSPLPCLSPSVLVANMASYAISSSLILVIHDNMINETNHIV
jgi:hypothetical protein